MKNDQILISHAATCKFCKKPITLKIDSAYDAIGDPMRLMQLAACNHCADLYEERRKWEDKIGKLCLSIAQYATRPKGEEGDLYKSKLTHLTKSYSLLIARWHGRNDSYWEEAFVEALMHAPRDYWSLIGRMWSSYEAYQGTLV